VKSSVQYTKISFPICFTLVAVLPTRQFCWTERSRSACLDLVCHLNLRVQGLRLRLVGVGASVFLSVGVIHRHGRSARWRRERATTAAPTTMSARPAPVAPRTRPEGQPPSCISGLTTRGCVGRRKSLADGNSGMDPVAIAAPLEPLHPVACRRVGPSALVTSGVPAAVAVPTPLHLCADHPPRIAVVVLRAEQDRFIPALVVDVHCKGVASTSPRAE
jgi:hypothetical protein